MKGYLEIFKRLVKSVTKLIFGEDTTEYDILNIYPDTSIDDYQSSRGGAAILDTGATRNVIMFAIAKVLEAEMPTGRIYTKTRLKSASGGVIISEYILLVPVYFTEEQACIVPFVVFPDMPGKLPIIFSSSLFHATRSVIQYDYKNSTWNIGNLQVPLLFRYNIPLLYLNTTKRGLRVVIKQSVDRPISNADPKYTFEDLDNHKDAKPPEIILALESGCFYQDLDVSKIEKENSKLRPCIKREVYNNSKSKRIKRVVICEENNTYKTIEGNIYPSDNLKHTHNIFTIYDENTPADICSMNNNYRQRFNLTNKSYPCHKKNDKYKLQEKIYPVTYTNLMEFYGDRLSKGLIINYLNQVNRKEYDNLRLGAEKFLAKSSNRSKSNPCKSKTTKLAESLCDTEYDEYMEIDDNNLTLSIISNSSTEPPKKKRKTDSKELIIPDIGISTDSVPTEILGDSIDVSTSSSQLGKEENDDLNLSEITRLASDAYLESNEDSQKLEDLKRTIFELATKAKKGKVRKLNDKELDKYHNNTFHQPWAIDFLTRAKYDEDTIQRATKLFNECHECNDRRNKNIQAKASGSQLAMHRNQIWGMDYFYVHLLRKRKNAKKPRRRQLRREIAIHYQDLHSGKSSLYYMRKGHNTRCQVEAFLQAKKDLGGTPERIIRDPGREVPKILKKYWTKLEIDTNIPSTDRWRQIAATEQAHGPMKRLIDNIFTDPNNEEWIYAISPSGVLNELSYQLNNMFIPGKNVTREYIHTGLWPYGKLVPMEIYGTKLGDLQLRDKMRDAIAAQLNSAKCQEIILKGIKSNVSRAKVTEPLARGDRVYVWRGKRERWIPGTVILPTTLAYKYFVMTDDNTSDFQVYHTDYMRNKMSINSASKIPHKVKYFLDDEMYNNIEVDESGNIMDRCVYGGDNVYLDDDSESEEDSELEMDSESEDDPDEDLDAPEAKEALPDQLKQQLKQEHCMIKQRRKDVNDPSHVCPICGVKNASKPALLKHLDNQHKANTSNRKNSIGQKNTLQQITNSASNMDCLAVTCGKCDTTRIVKPTLQCPRTIIANTHNGFVCKSIGWFCNTPQTQVKEISHREGTKLHNNIREYNKRRIPPLINLLVRHDKPRIIQQKSRKLNPNTLKLEYRDEINQSEPESSRKGKVTDKIRATQSEVDLEKFNWAKRARDMMLKNKLKEVSVNTSAAKTNSIVFSKPSILPTPLKDQINFEKRRMLQFFKRLQYTFDATKVETWKWLGDRKIGNYIILQANFALPIVVANKSNINHDNFPRIPGNKHNTMIRKTIYGIQNGKSCSGRAIGLNLPVKEGLDDKNYDKYVIVYHQDKMIIPFKARGWNIVKNKRTRKKLMINQNLKEIDPNEQVQEMLAILHQETKDETNQPVDINEYTIAKVYEDELTEDRPDGACNLLTTVKGNDKKSRKIKRKKVLAQTVVKRDPTDSGTEIFYIGQGIHEETDNDKEITVTDLFGSEIADKATKYAKLDYNCVLSSEHNEYVLSAIEEQPKEESVNLKRVIEELKAKYDSMKDETLYNYTQTANRELYREIIVKFSEGDMEQFNKTKPDNTTDTVKNNMKHSFKEYTKNGSIINKLLNEIINHQPRLEPNKKDNSHIKVYATEVKYYRNRFTMPRTKKSELIAIFNLNNPAIITSKSEWERSGRRLSKNDIVAIIKAEFPANNNDNVIKRHFSFVKTGAIEISEKIIDEKNLNNMFDPSRKDEVSEVISYDVIDRTKFLTHKQSDKNVISSRMVYTIKFSVESGKLIKAKSRWVARGFEDKRLGSGLMTKCHTVDEESLMVLLTLACTRKWCIHSTDITCAFLQGLYFKPGVEVYIQIPDVIRNNPEYKLDNFAYLLKKPIYGLADAPYLWQLSLFKRMTEYGFERSATDPAMWVLYSDTAISYLNQYYDKMKRDVPVYVKEYTEQFLARNPHLQLDSHGAISIVTRCERPISDTQAKKGVSDIDEGPLTKIGNHTRSPNMANILYNAQHHPSMVQSKQHERPEIVDAKYDSFHNLLFKPYDNSLGQPLTMDAIHPETEIKANTTKIPRRMLRDIAVNKLILDLIDNTEYREVCGTMGIHVDDILLGGEAIFYNMCIPMLKSFNAHKLEVMENRKPFCGREITSLTIESMATKPVNEESSVIDTACKKEYVTSDLVNVQEYPIEITETFDDFKPETQYKDKEGNYLLTTTLKDKFCVRLTQSKYISKVQHVKFSQVEDYRRETNFFTTIKPNPFMLEKVKSPLKKCIGELLWAGKTAITSACDISLAASGESKVDQLCQPFIEVPSTQNPKVKVKIPITDDDWEASIPAVQQYVKALNSCVDDVKSNEFIGITIRPVSTNAKENTFVSYADAGGNAPVRCGLINCIYGKYQESDGYKAQLYVKRKIIPPRTEDTNASLEEETSDLPIVRAKKKLRKLAKNTLREYTPKSAEDETKETMLYTNHSSTILNHLSKAVRRVHSSSTSGELLALKLAIVESLYIRNLLIELGLITASQAIKIFSDNQNIINSSHKEMLKPPTERNIRNDYFFIASLIYDNYLTLDHVPGEYNPADVFTKLSTKNLKKLAISFIKYGSVGFKLDSECKIIKN